MLTEEICGASALNWDLAVASHRSYIRLKASDIALQLYLACAQVVFALRVDFKGEYNNTARCSEQYHCSLVNNITTSETSNITLL